MSHIVYDAKGYPLIAYAVYDFSQHQSGRRPADLSLEFADKKGGKNCTKGKPCGGSCIAKGRNCRKDKKDLSKNQQQAADALAKVTPSNAGPGGALVLAKQALTGGTKGKGSRKASGGTDADSRYASANPSDDDAKKFLKDKTSEFLGSSKTDRRESSKDLYAARTKSKVKDRASYVENVLKDYEVRISNFQSGYDGGRWSASQEKKLQAAQDRVANAKDAASRKRAEAQVAKLSREKEDDAAYVKRMNDLIAMTPEQRRAQAEKQHDDRVKELTQERAERRAAYQRGDKKVVGEVDQAVRDNLIKPMLDDPDSSEFIPRANRSTGRVEQPSVVEQAKAYLRLVHRRDGGDTSALGLGKGKPSLNDLRRAYRKRAAETHPDRGGSREAFEAVRGSYERLMKQYYPEQVDMREFDLSGVWMVRQPS